MFIIKSSDEVPRTTLLKRFPVPKNSGLAPESRVKKGKHWPAPAGAQRVKLFQIYRYDPESADGPRLAPRSAARRVGHACRSRWSPYH